MVSSSLITQVLVALFEEKAGKFQVKAPPGEAKALQVTFNLTIDHDKESGYRHLDLIIYAPMNYVGVYTRERWTVIPLEDLEDGEDGETFVKPGKDYTDQASEWKQVAYHDSGWRTDGLDQVLRDYEKRILSFNTSGGSFYQVVQPPKEIEVLS